MPTYLYNPALNPFPRYRKMRETHLVTYNSAYATWQVFRYEEVQRVLTNWNFFSFQSNSIQT